MSGQKRNLKLELEKTQFPQLEVKNSQQGFRRGRSGGVAMGVDSRAMTKRSQIRARRGSLARLRGEIRWVW